MVSHIVPSTKAAGKDASPAKLAQIRHTLDMGNVLVSFTGLSFLGLGAAVGTAEWGAMVSAGQSNLLTNWWLSTFPGLAIFVSALVLNMLGDTIQDILASGVTRRI